MVRWTENNTEVSTSASYSFTLTADRDLTAEFARNSDGGGYVPTRPKPVEPEEPETPANGWVQEDGGWYLYQDGVLATGWNLYNSTWYYLNSDGKMLTGWQNLNGTWYYLKDWGGMAANTTVDGYYLNASGAWVM